MMQKQDTGNATAKRVRGDVKPTLRRRTSTRSRYHSTSRRTSTAHDVHVAMMPDLSENLSNEERTWEEIMQIKAMPVSMAQKKEMKSKLQSATKLRLQGFEQFKWQRRKFWQQFKSRWKETYSKLELWRHSLKMIEGNFGTGVVAYFLFLKWLMFLNLAIFAFIFLFIILPAVLLDCTDSLECSVGNTTNLNDSSNTCGSGIGKNNSFVLDIIQGTGWMENTLLFYGVYPRKIFGVDTDSSIYYDLPVAYVIVALVYFLISLIAIVKSAAQGFKDRLVEGEGQFYQFCNLVFGGWDYCIHNEKSALVKHKALYNEIKGCLEAERLKDERQSRSREEKMKLILVRCVINVIVILVLAGAGFAIYKALDFSNSKLGKRSPEETYSSNDLNTLLLEYLPSISIVGLNLLVPNLFSHLVTYEHYTPLFVVRITLLRTVLLRLASLVVLLQSFYSKVFLDSQPDSCWEIYVGQQIYKLVILDFVTHIFVTFIVNFPRMLIARHSKSKVAKFIGEQEFELPKHVLDIVYSQTLCWVGSFYAPILPAMATIEYFLLFYIKKFACLVNSTPSSTVYRASKSNSLFMAVLLFSFLLAFIPVAYSIAESRPSSCCGPFVGQSTVWQLVVTTFNKFPPWIQTVLNFFSTAGFAVPAFITLVLCLYYFSAVSAANKQMVQVLKNQLVLEGHDKQFLLDRLSAFIKQQQQEHQKAMRQMEMSNVAGMSSGS
ncbi:transmembrane channel-like protein 7 isoform X2 [Anabrus simplex]|uniref:transmembrane channel-like protein 7 isoform X2 n=1 Tax=Anabrus simplex TaxID=316456 RepID=UPI0035A39E6E